MEHIVIQSAGTFSVAVLCLIITIHQILLLLRKPKITWVGWSAGISFSGMLYAIGVFFEYNAPAGPVNRFAGLLEFTAIIFLLHCAYGFTLAILGRKAKHYHIWGGLFHALVLVLLWSTDFIVADRFVSRNFLGMARPFVELDIGPLGPLFEFYGALAAIGMIRLWAARPMGPTTPYRSPILWGIVFWLAMAIHDGLGSMGLPIIQYIMEYGFLGFSFIVLWVVFNGFEDISTIEKFRAVAEFSNDLIVMIQNEKVVFDNPVAVSLFGRQVTDGTIEEFLNAVVPEDRPRFMHHYRGLLDSSELPEFFMIRIRPNGEEMILEIRAKLVSYRSQPAILAFLRDTTQRIREEEGNFSTFFESMEDMILVGKPDGAIIHTNTAASQKLGYPARELEKMRIHDLCPERWRLKAETEIGAVSHGERKIWNLPLVSTAGREIPVELRIWFAMWNGAECIFAIAKDQTAENDAKDLLNRLFRNNPALMALFSMPERRLTEVNNSFLAAFGYDRDEIIGKTGNELGFFPGPAMDENLSQAFLADGHLFNVEFQVQRKNGSVFDCLFSAEIIRHRGRRLLLSVMIDISDRKQAECQLRQAHDSLEQRVRERTRAIREMHAQMVMQEKMASIGQLAAGVAHELNNPVNFVSTNFAGLKEHFADLCKAIRAYRKFLADRTEGQGRNRYSDLHAMEEELQIDYILKDTPVLFEESRRGFDRIAKIIHSMRQFSHTDPYASLTPFDINKAVENAIIIARNTYKHCAQVHLELGALPEIACHPEQIHQVLLNLIVNSAQAIESQNRQELGNITVRTFAETDNVACQIIDDGPGIANDIRSQIFEAFFTTKPAGEGSGLGLSLSYDIIVNKHKGSLKAECPETGGTVFTVCIPNHLGEDQAPFLRGTGLPPDHSAPDRSSRPEYTSDRAATASRQAGRTSPKTLPSLSRTQPAARGPAK
ncbi:MAG: PAS domain S-box protein [Desulfobacterales bacterium]|nr:PAS domain S-box protein [Desulfobacterales bacterium]